MLQYLLLYLFWGLKNSAISPWTLPIIFHATGAWPKEGRTCNTASSSCSKQKNNSKQPGFNSSCKRRRTRVFCFPENLHFCFHFLSGLISAQDGQLRHFKPKQTPLFSRPQIPGLEMCFQISTTPCLAGCKINLKIGPEHKKGTCLLIFTKTFWPRPFFFSLSFLSSHSQEIQA